VLTWRQLLASVEARLGSLPDARWVVERASGWDTADLLLHGHEMAPGRAVAHADAMVARRERGEPLQYVLGRWSFRQLELLVDRRVLIPRPETEGVAGVAVAEAEASGRDRPLVVDLGTGSGAIALTVAAEHRTSEVWATDVSTDALAVARANLSGLGTTAATRVRLAEGRWWEALPADLAGRIDVVVSNPPYVADHERLPPGVSDWEPSLALRAGPTGLEALRVIIAGAPKWLAPAGSVVVEIAPHQADEVISVARNWGYSRIEILPDLVGRPRVLVAGRVIAHELPAP
jgi:release factor glutamine methyltransferase